MACDSAQPSSFEAAGNYEVDSTGLEPGLVALTCCSLTPKRCLGQQLHPHSPVADSVSTEASHSYLSTSVLEREAFASLRGIMRQIGPFISTV